MIAFALGNSSESAWAGDLPILPVALFASSFSVSSEVSVVKIFGEFFLLLAGQEVRGVGWGDFLLDEQGVFIYYTPNSSHG
jgi:hypothetical protein